MCFRQFVDTLSLRTNSRSHWYSPWSISDAEAPADRSDRERSDANAVGLFILALLRKAKKMRKIEANETVLPSTAPKTN